MNIAKTRRAPAREARAPRGPRLPSHAIEPHSEGTSSLASRLTASSSDVASTLLWCREVNERCMEMLVTAARCERGIPFPLVAELRGLLKSADPSMRQRAARRAFLLVDMQFHDRDWWHSARAHPGKPMRTPPWRGAFPRQTAILLARATLILAWNANRADPATAGILLGMTQPVAEVIATLKLDEIDRIAQTRFRYVRPRWDDRPAVWRKLLLAAREDDAKLMREFNLHALQLLAGDLLVPAPRALRTDTHAGQACAPTG